VVLIGTSNTLFRQTIDEYQNKATELNKQQLNFPISKSKYNGRMRHFVISIPKQKRKKFIAQLKLFSNNY